MYCDAFLIRHTWSSSVFFKQKQEQKMTDAGSNASGGNSSTNASTNILVGSKSQEELSFSYLPELYGHSRKVYALGFNPTGSLLASGSVDKTIRLWAIETVKSSSFMMLAACY